MDRTPYTEETRRTIPMVEGKTIKTILTAGSFKPEVSREVTGFRLVFDDGTEAEVVARVVEGVAVLDIARSTGLYRSGMDMI